MKESKKYKDILNTSKDLFWKHGFKRVSIEEICKYANVSKMTFYKYFPNKIELAKTILEKIVRQNFDNFRENMNSDSPAREKVKKILCMKLENSKNVSEEFLTDFYKSDELGIREYINDLTQRVWAEMIGEFKIAQEKGIFRKDLNIELFFALSMKTMDIISDEKIMKIFPTPEDMIVELSNLIVYGIVPHDEDL